MTAAEFSALMLLSAATSFTPGPNTTLSTALAANRVVAQPALRWGILGGGVGYLLWLAWRLAGSSALAQVDASRLNVTFLQGVLLQFLNIKAWMLALSVVAGWIAGRPDATERTLQVLPLMLAFGFFSNLTYATTGSLLRGWLAHGQRLLVFNRCMATALVLTAVWMLWSVR